MKYRSSQSGVTLIVSLIMLVVLTLLVVSAIRFGNINLRITQNAQAEAEAAAAAQVAIEQMVAEMNDAENLSEVAAKPNQPVSTGATSYAVAVTKPACVLSRNVVSTELNYKNPEDQKCYGGAPGDMIIGPDGAPLTPPSECKQQQWEVQADVNDASSGARLTMLQGMSVRVSVEKVCP
jgi:Tfp pilus assembly protein PilV